MAFVADAGALKLKPKSRKGLTPSEGKGNVQRSHLMPQNDALNLFRAGRAATHHRIASLI